ncbi:Isoquinoline 1-oxidoreductase subunit beta [Zhongshania aliphaticivorans]|uniref:Isoquinoline 1-oxidoreductase subunit beta n=1 Tax=Zhongshania aliphaticivorans TaxID=1470434 RepID=A0A5S9PFR2_9GAMM|nr:molybdopterin cofactor-binding domain-containing protein [Zhongshania aliphaticivorans]CAA0102585.1 Isoquinoline 1-oxidoreductase subunit beta [Zhongshania aliphaticivorans]CAA0114091.1 Isoquinoline 1-oxidoreductase subunit beta [Zhongshania aliphaticivorans]
MKSVNNVQQLSRRDFLKFTGIAGSGLILATTLPLGNVAFASEAEGQQAFNLFVSIATNGRCFIICHRSEMGQGIRTGIPQIIAEELCADWANVEVVQGLANEQYGSQNTDGSRSIRNNYQRLREMGAAARTMLEQAAATIWSVELSSVYADQGYVIHNASQKKLGFGELAEAAAKLSAPDPSTLTFKNPKDFTFIGQAMASVDLEQMVNGEAVFGQDVVIPNMVYASIERSPVTGGKVLSFDKQAALKIAGVIKVIKMPEQSLPALFKPINGVAVIASNTWAALKGRKALNVQWELGQHASHDSASYLNELRERITSPGKIERSKGDAYQALDNAAVKIDATYTVPYLAHAPMEPPAATASYKEGFCEVWTSVQTPQRAQKVVAEALGLNTEQVKINVTFLGGGFGRKSKPDFAVEAAILAKGMARPVKVTWSREDEIRQGYYHAISAQYYSAGFDQNKQLTSWVQRTAFPSISWTYTGQTDEPQAGELGLGFIDVPLAVENLSCETHKAKAHVRIGWLRSVCNIQHGFAIGSFVDEVAAASGKSTHQTWLDLLGNERYSDTENQGFEFLNYGESVDEFPLDVSRLKQVLNLVVEKSGATSQAKGNEAWGISVHRSFVAYVAVATKVRVVDNKVTVLEMHNVIDAGRVINPDRVAAQMEGAMIFGLSLALMGEIAFKSGAVEQSNYHDYPLLKMPQSPYIKTYIIESTEPPAGVGEPGVPPVAASLANAIFHATGTRIRDLPINKHFGV